jgi:hypothetical protein
MLETLCEKNRGEVEVECLQVDICKYRNVGGSLCKRIVVKLMWHAHMLRDFKLISMEKADVSCLHVERIQH